MLVRLRFEPLSEYRQLANFPDIGAVTGMDKNIAVRQRAQLVMPPVSVADEYDFQLTGLGVVIVKVEDGALFLPVGPTA